MITNPPTCTRENDPTYEAERNNMRDGEENKKGSTSDSYCHGGLIPIATTRTAAAKDALPSRACAVLRFLAALNVRLDENTELRIPNKD